ncbi:MAG: ABC transporter ATP-binding protein [Candidatus Aquicultor sp.]|nr:ABC transporter ATP-binding protein [Candidatus Aquicultor sp.]
MESNTGREKVVVAQDLTKVFDGLTAVKGISFTVERGERVGFLGPNGAGKTTTIRMLYGMSPPTTGSLSVLGLDVRDDIRDIKRRIGVVPQETNLDTDLSVRENLEVYANYFGIPKKPASERIHELLAFMQLEERADTMVDTLSGGMKRRLLLARALLNNPELLILDEPTTGLDPQARHLIWDRLKSLQEQNVTLILTTHYMDEASRLCDRIIIMDEGSIIAEGIPLDLIETHVSSEALEIRVAEGQREALQELLVPKSEYFETQQDTYVFFARAADELMQAVKDAGFEIEYALLRRSTLEDVFLKLTGRRLRD